MHVVASPWTLRYEDLYPLPLLDLRPKLSPLLCLHVSWLSHSCVEGPCSKILVRSHCSFYWWAGATLIAIYSTLKPFPHRSCRCLINWILSQCLGSVPWILFILSPTFPRLGMSISLGLMLLLDKTKSHVNLYLVITWVDTRRIWKFGKKSPAQLSLAIKLCSLALCFDFRIPCLLTPNLVTTFVCYPSFA